ncbi:hypothetical protein [Microbacterium sp. NPDC064584]|uniref:hypothetical protein n=1 Tax=Microbacterium sp. NPDC064584 TaxID=3155817 RepID=UPI00342C8202
MRRHASNISNGIGGWVKADELRRVKALAGEISSWSALAQAIADHRQRTAQAADAVVNALPSETLSITIREWNLSQSRQQSMQRSRILATPRWRDSGSRGQRSIRLAGIPGTSPRTRPIGRRSAAQITRAASTGCNRLLREHIATVVITAEDVRELPDSRESTLQRAFHRSPSSWTRRRATGFAR